jgi:hypothetical protein
MLGSNRDNVLVKFKSLSIQQAKYNSIRIVATLVGFYCEFLSFAMDQSAANDVVQRIPASKIEAY